MEEEDIDLSFITRNIINHLDFDVYIDLPNKQYIFKNKHEDEEQKLIFIEKFAIVPVNQYADFIWPSSVTVKKNNNYVYSIQGITNKGEVDFMPVIAIDCSKKESIEIIFDNYDNNNTNIYLMGYVTERTGTNINL
jgi:hypothetical protein